MKATERHRRWRALPALGCLLATLPVAHAAIPETVTYQGRLSQSGGVPVDGTVTIVFSLYAVAQETEPPTPPLWTETHSLAVVQGLFSAILGASTVDPHPLTLPFDRPYYLGLRAGTDPEMTPRQPFTSAPYAMRANQADSVPYGSVTTETLADGAVSPDKLAEVCQEGDFLVRTAAGWDCRSTACLTPGTEACDNLDNDCNGVVDDGYRNVTTGQYDQAVACGNCSTDCTVVFARPHAQGQCDASLGPRCVMTCDVDYLDGNGVPDDGCELRLDGQATYVSGGDAAADDLAGCGRGPAGTGGGNRPCRTITRGIAEAVSAGRSKVLVADGLYEGAVTVANGVSLLGGHRPDTWERHVASTLTILRAAAQTANAKTLVAHLITSTTVVEGFVIEGPRNAQRAGNSYAVWIRDCGASLSIRDNVIRGGTGGPGLDGATGADGAEGVAGTTGQDAIETSVFSLAACQAFAPAGGNQGAFGDGGVLSCGASSVAGGAGAGAVCPVSNNRQTTGTNGQSAPAGGTGGAGGAGGYDRYSTDCSTFFTGGYDPRGFPGATGQAGSSGAAGEGCTLASGGVSGGEWVGSDGGNGAAGASGGGGGGGGAGGGADVQINCSGTPDDTLGGSGGGGGSGACGGAAGAPGEHGGGAFAVLVSFSAVSSSLPILTGNTIARGWGGEGGRGGNGGSGGLGGSGAAGGNIAGRWASFMGPGGRGGDGGHGGHGSGGGGGCGGASYGILVHNASGTPPYRTGNVFLGGGGGGTGGAGGGSVGNGGTAGADGSSGDTNF